MKFWNCAKIESQKTWVIGRWDMRAGRWSSVCYCRCEIIACLSAQNPDPAVQLSAETESYAGRGAVVRRVQEGLLLVCGINQAVVERLS